MPLFRCKFIFIAVSIFLFATLTLFAQMRYQGGVLPQVQTTFSLAKDWRANLRLESRVFFLEGRVGREQRFREDYSLTDFAFVVAKNTGIRSSLGGGVLIRFEEEEEPIIRLIQQFSTVTPFDGYRLAHRFMADQTIRPEATEYRLRYRLSAEMPLEGLVIDPYEWYVRFGNEYIFSYEDKLGSLESRLLAILGHNLPEGTKIEFGLDYRISNFIHSSGRHQMWMYVGYLLHF